MLYCPSSFSRCCAATRATAESTFSIDDDGQKEGEDRPPGVQQHVARVPAQHLEKNEGQHNIDSHA